MLHLTLEKEDVRFDFFKKERRLSKNLLQGLLLALFFHILFLTIFRVVSPAPLEESVTLLPSSVTIDLGRPSSSTAEKPLLPLEIDQAPLLEMTLPGAVCSIDQQSNILCHDPDFSEIEKLDYTPLEIEFDHS